MHLPDAFRSALLPALAAAAGCASPASHPDEPVALDAAGGAEPAIPDLHDRPIVERDGVSLLWASETEAGEPEWFDVTDARVDPATFQFGIGKDTIPSIDAPVFVAPDDARLAERGVTSETPVLGVRRNGIARAYPVEVLDLHEVVNDEFGGEALAVLW